MLLHFNKPLLNYAASLFPQKNLLQTSQKNLLLTAGILKVHRKATMHYVA